MSTTTTPASSEWVFDEEAFLKKIPFRVVRTNLKGAYSVVAPPDDFDPNTASANELVKNGILWRRPVATDPAALQDAWHKAFSRKWLGKDREVPVFQPVVGRTHILKKSPGKVKDATFANFSWSGAATLSGGPYTGAVGMWEVPNVLRPPWPPSTSGSGSNAYESSSWVGLDGYLVSNDVLQAGVEQYVDGNGHAHYTAWYEWYVDIDAKENIGPGYINEVPISTVPVAASDEIFVSVQYIGMSFGYIWLANRTTGKHFAQVLAPPPNANFAGNTVEWIMEDPDGGEDATSLAKFTPVIFTSAIACTAAGGTNNPENCDTLNIETTGERVLTSASVGNYTAAINCVSDGLLSYEDAGIPGNVSNPTIVGFDDWLEFKSLFGGKNLTGQGRIYAVDQQGRLLSYGDNGSPGNVSDPVIVGFGGWLDFKFLFAGTNMAGEDRIYAVDQQSRLLSYGDNGGPGNVSDPAIVGNGGWLDFKFLFAGTNMAGEGRIYAVDQQGRLLSYGDNGGPGNVSDPAIVGNDGWRQFKFLFGGTNLAGQGHIYTVFSN
jgi:Peptidase A4 family